MSYLRNWIGMLGILFPFVVAADNYVIDSSHTYPSFETPHMGISYWRGKFNKTTGTVTLDRAAKKGTADIVIDVASIDFGHDTMNEHALSEKWLDVKKYPTMTYKGNLKFKEKNPVGMDGDLTLHGITKPVHLTIKAFKCIDHPFYKKEVCGADAYGELNRADFGITQHAEHGAGKFKIHIQVEAIKDSQ